MTHAPSPVAGRLGGLPDLPLDMPWPEWEGNGPLSPIASLDCGALSAAGDSGLALPASGTLLFFLFDGSLGDDCMVYPSDPGTRPGPRVTARARRHPAPAELSPYPGVTRRPLPGRRVARLPAGRRGRRTGAAPADLAARRFEEAMFTSPYC
ncbi:DUF1963 domain-containing protein [Streptomyces erythrochromogenes]|uniref:DUF1963 domain-containing protein n=1 Tax=Streptomyces erythrochromogenes TaxID=285574 RepID=UPI00380D6108